MNKTQISKEQLTSILDGLFGCETIANQIDDPQPIADPHVVATYNDLEGQFRFAISCDLPLANSLGAALTMIPPGGVEDAVAEGQVPANIAENLREVLSICSAVLRLIHDVSCSICQVQVQRTVAAAQIALPEPGILNRKHHE